MNKTEQQPAGITGIDSTAAATRDGQPISLNRPPAADLSPWVARVYSTQGLIEPTREIHCGVMADTHIARVLLDGKWHADTLDGPEEYSRCVLFFGQQRSRMPISVTGTFRTAGLALKPGVLTALRGPSSASVEDRIVRYAELGGNDESILARFDREAGPAAWMETMEDCFRQLIAEAGAVHPDPIAEAFERATFTDPTQPIAGFAKAHGISVRQLERIIRRDFGTTPKHVMRRARVMDLASNLRGVAERSEAEELALRYFDQSHINRDFLEFFGMTPMRFVRTPQPFITMTLEARQARRLETLERIQQGAPRPWE